MKILGLDTSTNIAVLFITDQSTDLFGATGVPHERNLSAQLYASIDRLLRNISLTIDDVDAFAVGLGPGSFTGVRVAVTTMRTFAQVTGKPLIGVPTLDIFASYALTNPGLSIPEGDRSVLVVVPSRRNEVYAQIFSAGGHASSPAVTATYAEAHEMRAQLTGAGIVTGPNAILDTLFGLQSSDSGARLPAPIPSPYDFAVLAAQALLEGRTQDPLSLDPMYVAPPAVSQHKNRTFGP